MALTFTFVPAPSKKSDIAVVGVLEGGKLTASAAALDKKSGGFLSSALKASTKFKGKSGQAMTTALPKKSGFARVMTIGIGKAADLKPQNLETLGGKIYLALQSAGAASASLYVDQDFKDRNAGAAIAAGMKLRSYTYTKFKSSKDKDITSVDKIEIVTSEASRQQKAYASLDAELQGVFLARDLVNEPPNTLYPQSYAERIAKELRPLGVEVEILDDKKIQKLKMGGVWAVGMGSLQKPRVVILRWNKGKKGPAPLGFVGKGVTFDTGGISIKPAADMDLMKMDMGGSAAVVGLFRALAKRKAKINAVGVVGLAENMPSGDAFRPGDIIKSMAGKTIEILNTDAEGRLILADCLTYIQRTYKPRILVDLATLTGAMMVALGFDYCGSFVNRDDLWKRLDQSGKDTSEKLWRMPLDAAFRKEMEGRVADLQNLGNLGRYGGACSAAGFLEHFIENDTPWAHLDIAGTAWSKIDKPTVPKGGTGFGVRLLNRLAQSYE